MIRVATGLPVALTALLRTQPLTPAKVEFAWRHIAGAAVARATRLTLRDDGILDVQVETRQWKREIERVAAILLTRLEPVLGAGAVTRIVVADRFQDRPARRRVTGPRPKRTA